MGRGDQNTGGQKWVWTLVVASVLLSGCAVPSYLKPSTYLNKSASSTIVDKKTAFKSKGRYQVGKPYQIKGNWYYPKESFTFDEVGVSSWYGAKFHGRQTANGEIFDRRGLTAAHKTLQLPTLVEVTNMENGHQVILRVNDRGPFIDGRFLDVSERAAEVLGFRDQGVARVRARVLSQESRALARAMGRAEPAATPPARPGTVSVVNDARASNRSQILNARPQTPVRNANQGNVQGNMQGNAGVVNIALHIALYITLISVAYRGNVQGNMQGNAGVVNLQAPNNINRANSLNAPQGNVNQGGNQGGNQGANLGGNQGANLGVSSAVSGGIYVQVAAFVELPRAQGVVRQFDGLAEAVIMQAQVNGRQYYRVRLGPFSNAQQASEAKQLAADMRFYDAHIVRIN